MKFKISFLPTIIGRSLLLFTGVLLFATVTPHKTPADMARLHIDTASGSVSIHPIFFDAIILNTSLGHILTGTAFLLLGLLLVSSAGRQAMYRNVRNLKAAIALLGALGLFFFTIIPTEDGAPIIIYLLLASLGILAMAMALYPLSVWLIQRPIGFKIRSLFEALIHHFFNINNTYLLVTAFVVAFTATNLISYHVFEHIPHVQDSIAHVFHAKIFALGKLTLLSHPIEKFFDFSHIINDGTWYSVYPPGHTFLIMLGLLINMPWIINPLLGSLSIVLLYFIGAELYDDKTGRIALLLGLLSPFILFMSSEFMSHGSELFFLSLFVLFFAKTLKHPNLIYSIFSGTSLGMALLARPMTALAISAPFAAYAAFYLIRHYKSHAPPLLTMLATCVAFIGVLASFNYATNGDPLLFGHEVKWGSSHNPGFGNGIWGEPHSPAKGFEQTMNNLNALNKYLFEWPIPGLLFMFIPFVVRTRNIWDHIMLGSFILLPAAYFFFWYQDWCFGPRYIYEASLMAIVLTARGILLTPNLIRDVFGLISTPERIKMSVACLVAVCILTGMTSNFPALIRFYSHTYWGVNASTVKAVEEAGIENAVVFVGSTFASVFSKNAPTLDGSIIFAKHLGRNNRLLMEYYPDRKYYAVGNNKITEIFHPDANKPGSRKQQDNGKDLEQN